MVSEELNTRPFHDILCLLDIRFIVFGFLPFIYVRWQDNSIVQHQSSLASIMSLIALLQFIVCEPSIPSWTLFGRIGYLHPAECNSARLRLGYCNQLDSLDSCSIRKATAGPTKLLKYQEYIPEY